MKNIFKYILIVGLSAVLWACTNPEDLVVRYAASTPKIDTAMVKETQITYGDSIHIKIAVSDKVAPLSTLVLRVVCNNEVVSSETIRTKGNSSAVSRTIAVPFVANRPDGIPVKIYLTQTNVSGISKDSIVSTTTAKRPVIDHYYVVPDFGSGTSAELLPDPTNSLLVKAENLLYKTTLSFKIATKLDKFKRIDWTGKVFGKVGDGIGLIDTKGESFSVTDGTLVGISIFTFDALKFQVKVGGKLLEPVKTLDVIADLPGKPETLNNNTDFRGGNIYFGEGVEVTFSNITNLTNNISPDYFQVTGANTAKFLGKTGLYKAYFLTTSNYLYIEPQPEATYPDAVWVCGTGFGRPQSPYATTASWNWNSPLDYYATRKIAEGIYQVTMYCKNEPSTDVANIYGKCDFKFFHKRGWWDGHELWVDTYTLTPPFLGPTGVKGNVKVLSATVLDGVYRFTVNENTKTFTAEKLK
ncbi:MAG: DUF5016 domain-containing protein [Paludibacter sp.]